MNKIAPSILATENRGLKILYVDADETRCDEFEAKAEQDRVKDLQRIDVYTATNIPLARDLLKKHGCQLAVFQDGLEGKDFPYIQLELQSSQPSISLVPIIGIPSVGQLTATQQNGGIYAYVDRREFRSYEDFKELVIDFAREWAGNRKSLQDVFAYSKVLQNCIFLADPGKLAAKSASRIAIDKLILNYDFGPDDVGIILAAEQIYSPEISAHEYKRILDKDKYHFAAVLSQTASWKHPDSKPQGASGFLITVANFIGWQLTERQMPDSIITAILARPNFLLHPALRTLSKERLVHVVDGVLARLTASKSNAA